MVEGDDEIGWMIDNLEEDLDEATKAARYIMHHWVLPGPARDALIKEWPWLGELNEIED
jgi:hypothetical protein